MGESANANTAKLPSSPSAAQRLIFNDDREAIAFYDTQGRKNPLKIEGELPFRMAGNMEHPQPSVVYHMEADRASEAEDIHVTHQPNNKVDFGAGVQHTEVNSISGESESDGEMQESDDGDKSPMLYGNNIGSHLHADDEATSSGSSSADMAEGDGETVESSQYCAMLAKSRAFYNDVHDEERDIFVDFDEDADVDDEEAALVHQEDNEIEEDIGIGFGSIEALIYPETTQIIDQHLSAPNQQSFTTLDDLLSSHNAPGRGLYNVEKVLEHEEGRVTELEEKIKYITAELEEVKARRDKTNEIVRNAGATFSGACGESGIHDDLWKEYEAFCESLEPKFGNRGGWSVTCFENHNGSYVQWDPDLELFVQSAEMPLGSCNFRCEATRVEHVGRTEYVVEFWPLANPEPHSETASTWRHQYPKLYSLAEQAANQMSQANPVANALLRSLPHPNLPFSGGWLFEYALEPGRAQHPTVSRRWAYRSACRIPIDGQQDQEDFTVQSQIESAASQDEEMEYDEAEVEAAESQDVKMEIETELTESQDVKMEDDD